MNRDKVMDAYFIVWLICISVALYHHVPMGAIILFSIFLGVANCLTVEWVRTKRKGGSD